jgi:hypothetical protein
MNINSSYLKSCLPSTYSHPKGTLKFIIVLQRNILKVDKGQSRHLTMSLITHLTLSGPPSWWTISNHPTMLSSPGHGFGALRTPAKVAPSLSPLLLVFDPGKQSFALSS